MSFSNDEIGNKMNQTRKTHQPLPMS